MAESDPGATISKSPDWVDVRRDNGRAGLRKLVALIRDDRTDMAPAPLALHTSI